MAKRLRQIRVESIDFGGKIAIGFEFDDDGKRIRKAIFDLSDEGK